MSEKNQNCNGCDNELYKELDEFIGTLEIEKKDEHQKKGLLIQILHKAQDIFGFLPDTVQTYIANKLDISPAKVFGVVTFYSYFTMVPKGKHVINVCMGTACYVRGAEKIIEELKKEIGIEPGQTSDDGMWTLTSLRCVGACGLAPVMMIDDEVYGKVTPDQVKGLIEQVKAAE